MPSDNAPNPRWWIVECPHCHAGVGQPCMNPSGTLYQYSHSRRQKLTMHVEASYPTKMLFTLSKDEIDIIIAGLDELLQIYRDYVDFEVNGNSYEDVGTLRDRLTPKVERGV